MMVSQRRFSPASCRVLNNFVFGTCSRIVYLYASICSLYFYPGLSRQRLTSFRRTFFHFPCRRNGRLCRISKLNLRARNSTIIGSLKRAHTLLPGRVNVRACPKGEAGDDFSIEATLFSLRIFHFLNFPTSYRVFNAIYALLSGVQLHGCVLSS